MNAALIVMTILGCNDAGTDCHYIATVDQRWPTIAMCDSVSESQLPEYANRPYPVIIAVCQDPNLATTASGLPVITPPPVTAPTTMPVTPAVAVPEPAEVAADTKPSVVTAEERKTLAGRAIQRVRNVLPTTEGVKTMMTKPVRLVEDSYSWVARKFEQ